MTENENKKILPIEIPYQQLSQDALAGVVRDYVLQEGTDYGHADIDLQDKMQAVYKQLAKGQAKIFFDQETESCFLAI